MTQGSTDTRSTVAAEDIADACAKVHCPADGECVDVEWSLLKPSGVVGDKHERAETDLAALSQTSA